MKQLFVVDKKDYDVTWPRSKRPSVRAIIERDGKLAMVHSGKYDYYSFPGGGIEEGESYEEALIREVKEEVGLTVIPESIKEFGSVLRLSNSHIFEHTVFAQENFYYTCKAQNAVEAQQLDGYEVEEKYALKFVAPEEALQKNRHDDHGEENGAIWIEHASQMLEFLIRENKENYYE